MRVMMSFLMLMHMKTARSEMCSSHYCAQLSTDTATRLDCGKHSGELIKEIRLGNDASCFNPPDVTGSCYNTMAVNFLKDECINKRTCKPLFPAACGLNDTLTVEIKCKFEDAASIILPLAFAMLALIGLALGTTVTKEAVTHIWQQKKRAFGIGLCSQFGVMPLSAYLLCLIFNLDTYVAVGAILCGSCPGGNSSNIMTWIARSDVSLSIFMSVVSTACALFMMPLLIFIYITNGVAKDSDDDIVVSWGNMFISLLTIVMPCLAGATIRYYNKTKKWGRMMIYKWIENIGAAISIILMIIMMVVAISNDFGFLSPAEFPKIWGLTSLMPFIGFLFGYLGSKIGRLSQRDALTVAFETGFQNYGIALSTVLLSYKGCRRADALTVPFIVGGLEGLWFLLLGISFAVARFLNPDEKQTPKSEVVSSA